jgi:hypothetical protein
MKKNYRGPSKDASYQISIHLAKGFLQRRYFRNQPIRNKNCLWQPYLLMDRDEMSNIYRGSPIDASYQVSVHLAKRRKLLKKLDSSPLKPFGQMNRNLVGSIYGKSSVVIAHFVLIRLQIWPP